jgi:hypothetical protein
LRRAYQAADHPPVAGGHAFVLMASEITGAASEVITSADAICGSILTSKGYRCFRRCVEEHSGAKERDRKEKVPCHGRTS